MREGWGRTGRHSCQLLSAQSEGESEGLESSVCGSKQDHLQSPSVQRPTQCTGHCLEWWLCPVQHLHMNTSTHAQLVLGCNVEGCMHMLPGISSIQIIQHLPLNEIFVCVQMTYSLVHNIAWNYCTHQKHWGAWHTPHSGHYSPVSHSEPWNCWPRPAHHPGMLLLGQFEGLVDTEGKSVHWAWMTLPS